MNALKEKLKLICLSCTRMSDTIGSLFNHSLILEMYKIRHSCWSKATIRVLNGSKKVGLRKTSYRYLKAKKTREMSSKLFNVLTVLLVFCCLISLAQGFGMQAGAHGRRSVKVNNS